MSELDPAAADTSVHVIAGAQAPAPAPLPAHEKGSGGGRAALRLPGRFTSGQLVFWITVCVLFILLPGHIFSELFVLRLGDVLVVAEAAMGLHILVNWTGELSLAQAALVGVPALAVANISSTHNIDPILLIPFGIFLGALVGGVVGLPALRAKGLFVVVVTIAAELGIESFFYTKSWLVGSGGEQPVATPSIGPWSFTTDRGLFPFLAAVFVLSVVVLRKVYHSKVVRGLLWIRENPEAAAAGGVPVNGYRALAYVLAGAFAGLSGALAATWTGVVSPGSYTLTQSLNYLIIVVIGGAGFVGGTIYGSFILAGGNLIIPPDIHILDYLGPLGLVFTLTTAKGGLNRAGREIASRWQRGPGPKLSARWHRWFGVRAAALWQRRFGPKTAAVQE